MRILQIHAHLQAKALFSVYVFDWLLTLDQHGLGQKLAIFFITTCNLSTRTAFSQARG